MQKPPRIRSRSLSPLAGLVLAFAGCADTEDPSSDPDNVDPPDLTAQMVMTPNGLVHSSCVQEVGEGDMIEESGTVTRPDGSTYQLPACAYDTMPEREATLARRAGVDPGASNVVPTDNGWTEAAWWHSPHYMKTLHGNFRVPTVPANQGSQTIFFFPSFEPPAGNAIIQPVLQWGGSAAGGGKYWAIASWYVWPGHSVHGPLRRVSVNDVLYGSLQASACTGSGLCTWSIVTQDKSHPTTSSISIRAGNPYTEVQGGVLEVYGVDSCAKYPASDFEQFYNLAFASSAGTVQPAFSHILWKTTCHELVQSSSSVVNLRWK
jgi:hypothetical protein